MKILIIGGGLQGLCSAQVLLERGHEVQLLEAHEGVGLETSYANGGLITPSKSETLERTRCDKAFDLCDVYDVCGFPIEAHSDSVIDFLAYRLSKEFHACTPKSIDKSQL